MEPPGTAPGSDPLIPRAFMPIVSKDVTDIGVSALSEKTPFSKSVVMSPSASDLCKLGLVRLQTQVGGSALGISSRKARVCGRR